MAFLQPLHILVVKFVWTLRLWSHRHFRRTTPKRHLHFQIRHHYFLHLLRVLVIPQLVTSLTRQCIIFTIHMIRLPICLQIFSPLIVPKSFGPWSERNRFCQSHPVLVMAQLFLYCVVKIPIIEWRWRQLIISVLEINDFCSLWLFFVRVYFLLFFLLFLFLVSIASSWPWSYCVFTNFKQRSFLFW